MRRVAGRGRRRNEGKVKAEASLITQACSRLTLGVWGSFGESPQERDSAAVLSILFCVRCPSQVLEVERNATTAEIKKAFRKWAISSLNPPLLRRLTSLPASYVHKRPHPFPVSFLTASLVLTTLLLSALSNLFTGRCSYSLR